MSCKTDVKLAILDKVIEELTEGRYTFSRLSNDTIQVNGKVDNSKTKAQHRTQARAIANELINRVNKSFNSHVTGNVMERSEFDPITVTFSISNKYINHVYNNLPFDQQTDNTQIPNNERNYINSNTGINTHNQIELFSPDDEAAGAFVKFIQLKRNQLVEYKRRLGNIKAEKRQGSVTKERLIQLNKLERELKLQTEGARELGIKGLEQEITELLNVKKLSIDQVGFYIEKDLQRLEKLANSNNIDDLREAQKLIDFYYLAGSFKEGVENPFFSQNEIFARNEEGKLTAVYALSDRTMQQYRDWGLRATNFQNTVNLREKEITVNTINSDTSVRKTYGDRKFSFDELVKKEGGLGDTDWVSMWTMDVTQGLFSHNGMMPQVMFSQLTNQIERKMAWARKMSEQIDAINPDVQKELMKMGYSLRGGGILGLTGASYQLFKEITKEGNETGGLIQRFVKEFHDLSLKATSNFFKGFNEANLYEDNEQKQRAINKAFEEFKKWKRNNTIILNLDNTSEEYKQSLIDILGERGYKEQVEAQEKLDRKYETDRQNMVEISMIKENKSSYDELSEKAKSDIAYWENNHNPKKGVEDFTSVGGIFFGNRKANSFMDYNVLIPRKYKPNIVASEGTNEYHFSDSKISTGYYSEEFKKIEDNPTLSKFYDILKEACETFREVMPYEMQQRTPVNTLPAMMKTSAEMIADKNTGVLSSLVLAFRHLVERVRLSFGVTKQSEISYAAIDPLTGRPNYRVNDEFLQGNYKAIKERMTIEKGKFAQAVNSSRPANNKVSSIGRYSSFMLNDLNESALILLADYIHVDISLADIRSGNLAAIKAITGENVEIGRYIRDFAIHSAVQSQSFDLAKLIKYFSNMTMMYAARQEALPVLEIMKKHYESIQKPKTNNLGTGIYNANQQTYMNDGLRTNAIRQMDDYFERVVLGNYDSKHLGPHGNKSRSEKYKDKIEKEILEIDHQLTLPVTSQDRREKLLARKEHLQIKKNIPNYGAVIYSNEDKKKLAEIENLLQTETNEKEREKLIKLRENLGGKVRTATAVFDNILRWVRTLRLGYNLSSMTTNFLEGVTSNMILSSMGEYFDPQEIYYGYSVAKLSFLKNITFGIAEAGLAKRCRSLMDRFNVVIDSKNELQKSSVRTYADKAGWLNPHAGNQRVEYLNQSPIMIAMLRTLRIKDKEGNEHRLWEAFGNDGHLKEEFKTDENVNSWEELSGDDYLNFKQKLHKAITLGHGNYDHLRGMMIKSNTAGKALMMFKTWLPMQIYWRFAVQQDDLQAGTVGYKGRYWSYSKGTAALHFAAVGTAIFGPLGAAVGAVTGYTLGKFFGVDTGVGLLKETVDSTIMLAKKILGMPVNLLVGKQIIKQGDKTFEDWVGKKDFTQQDAKNLKGNMSDIAMQLAIIGLILLVKGMLWDDDDEPDDAGRIAHNILVNRLMALSSQATQYINPIDMYKTTLGSNAEIVYLTEVKKELEKVNSYIHGEDIIQSGINAGQSGLKLQTKKTFLPGIFKDESPLAVLKGKMPGLGFKSQAQRVFTESPFHRYFKSDETNEKTENKRDRAERKLQLMDELKASDFTDDKERKKEIKRVLDTELPTPAKLKKLQMTRDEYNEQNKQ